MSESVAWWMDRAVEFEINDRVRIVRRGQLNGKVKWAVSDGSYVLNKKGEWEYEPMPSSRTDAFIKRTRFDSKEAALEAFKKVKPDNS